MCESILWKRLRAGRLNGIKFKRQVPIEGYIVDFYCHKFKLIIEIYGHDHKNTSQKIKDRKRSENLERTGYKILTFWNSEIEKNINSILLTIINSIKP
jgi:very-short-patch-repair endonuclease